MGRTDGLRIAPCTLAFWLKDWEQRVRMRFAAEFGPLEGVPSDVDPPEVGEVPVRVRTYFEREVDARRWGGSDFDQTVAALRAELDAWMRPRGHVTVGLHIEREPAPPCAPCEAPQSLECEIDARDVAVAVTLRCVLRRRSASAWEALGRDDLSRWAARRFRTLCRRHLGPRTREELLARLPALRHAIHEDFRSRMIEAGYDPHALVTRIEPVVSRQRGATSLRLPSRDRGTAPGSSPGRYLRSQS